MAEPQDVGKLSPEQADKAIKWLDAKWAGDKRCWVCGTTKWTLEQHLVHPPIYRAGELMLGGLAYPQIAIRCSNCANTVFFNAVAMDVYKAAPARTTEALQAATEPKP